MLQQVSAITPSPTPTLTPTVTPTPTPWSIVPTFTNASGSLVSISRALAQITVWLGVVLVPLLLPFVLVALLVWVLVRHGRKGKVKPAETKQPVA